MVTVRKLTLWKYSFVQLLHGFVMTCLAFKYLQSRLPNHKSHACAVHNK